MFSSLFAVYPHQTYGVLANSPCSSMIFPLILFHVQESPAMHKYRRVICSKDLTIHHQNRRQIVNFAIILLFKIIKIMQNLSSRGSLIVRFIYIYIAYIAIMTTAISWDTNITMVKSIHLIHLVTALPGNRRSSDRRSQVPRLCQGSSLPSAHPG